MSDQTAFPSDHFTVALINEQAKRTGPHSLEFSPCTVCDAYRACPEPAAHGWGFCAIHLEFVRGNGCCGKWQAGV